MKSINVHSFGKRVGIICALFTLSAVFGTAAMAQCGASFTSMAEAAAAIQARSQTAAASASEHGPRRHTIHTS
jgi:hypothetical protein